MSRTRPTTVVTLMVTLSALSYFDRTILSIAGPTIMRELRISEIRMGWIYSAFLVLYTILMSPGGALADRHGPRLVLTLSGAGAALLTGFTGLAGGLGSFLALRLGLGAASAPLYPGFARMTRNWVPPAGAGRVMGFVTAGSPLGGAVSPLLFSLLMARYGWRASFWIAAALTGALYLLWHALVRDHPAGSPAVEPAPERRPPRWVHLLRDRNMRLLTLSYFCLNYFEYIFYYWLYYYFGEIRHLGAASSAVYVTIVMLAAMVTMPLGGWISDRLVARYGVKSGRRIVPWTGMTLSAIFLYAGAGGLGPLATVVLLMLALGFSVSTEGPFWATAIDIGGSQAGAAGGIMNTGGNAGGFLAPTVTPLLAHYLGWSAGLYFGSAVVALGVLAWFFIDVQPKAVPCTVPLTPT